MSQDDHIQQLIKSVHQKIELGYQALDAVPDEHAAEVMNCEANLAEQLHTLNEEYQEASHSPEATALEDLDRRASTLLSETQALKAAHEQLLSTVNQIVQTAAPAPAPQYEVPEVKVPDRFADDHPVPGFRGSRGNHEAPKAGRFAAIKAKAKDAVKPATDAAAKGKAQAESKAANSRASKPVRRLP